MAQPLHLMVAGHTNVGKTSLMRTLGRNAAFGQVANAPGTTQHVEALPLGQREDLMPGDAFLSRLNYPLIKGCFGLDRKSVV